MTAIWRKAGEDWVEIRPASFPSEAALHDLVEEAPNLLPLSGDPNLVVVGREVALGAGYADLVAIETDGRPVIIEIKLQRNSEARRAVVAQVLTYAAYLKGLDAEEFEHRVLRTHLGRFTQTTLTATVADADQSGSFDAVDFASGLSESLAAGAFRLVLVLDEAPAELVQLVGYLESISSGIVLDLITVSSYDVGEEQVLVPQRVDPEHVPDVVPQRQVGVSVSRANKPRSIDGTDPFERSFERTSTQQQNQLAELMLWASDLKERGLANLRSVIGDGRDILLVWIPGEEAGLVSIWNDNGVYISLWRSVFARHAWRCIDEIEALIEQPIGQGKTIRDPSAELLALLTVAYQEAALSSTPWDGKTYYVSFGEGPARNWEDAREYGFVAAGGGAWYSRTLRQLEVGNRVFAYIPKSSGVGGYVGVGEVSGPAVPVSEFIVSKDGRPRPLAEVARASDMDRDGATDPDIVEWIVPVKWLKTVPASEALKDSAFFANQNSAVKLTHGYTLERIPAAFETA